MPGAYGDRCLDCNGDKPSQCTACAAGFHPNYQGACVLCACPAPGACLAARLRATPDCETLPFGRSATHTTPLRPPPSPAPAGEPKGCIDCPGVKGECKACDAGLVLYFGKCVVPSCSVPNCAQCNTTGKKCKSCIDGEAAPPGCGRGAVCSAVWCGEGTTVVLYDELPPSSTGTNRL